MYSILQALANGTMTFAEFKRQEDAILEKAYADKAEYMRSATGGRFNLWDLALEIDLLYPDVLIRNRLYAMAMAHVSDEVLVLLAERIADNGKGPINNALERLQKISDDLSSNGRGVTHSTVVWNEQQ